MSTRKEEAKKARDAVGRLMRAAAETNMPNADWLTASDAALTGIDILEACIADLERQLAESERRRESQGQEMGRLNVYTSTLEREKRDFRSRCITLEGRLAQAAEHEKLAEAQTALIKNLLEDLAALSAK